MRLVLLALMGLVAAGEAIAPYLLGGYGGPGLHGGSKKKIVITEGRLFCFPEIS